MTVWSLRTATFWVARTLTFFLDYVNFINHLYFAFLIGSLEQDEILLPVLPVFFRRTLLHHKFLIVVVKCLYIICHLLLFGIQKLIFFEIVLRVPRGRKRFTLQWKAVFLVLQCGWLFAAIVAFIDKGWIARTSRRKRNWIFMTNSKSWVSSRLVLLYRIVRTAIFAAAVAKITFDFSHFDGVLSQRVGRAADIWVFDAA